MITNRETRSRASKNRNKAADEWVNERKHMTLTRKPATEHPPQISIAPILFHPKHFAHEMTNAEMLTNVQTTTFSPRPTAFV
jgi:hypothetical protein